MFSATVRERSSSKCWNTVPMRRRAARRSVADSAVKSLPSTTIRPEDGTSSRFRHRSKVDLPEPDGPTTPWIAPSGTARSTPSNAVTAPGRPAP